MHDVTTHRPPDLSAMPAIPQHLPQNYVGQSAGQLAVADLVAQHSLIQQAIKTVFIEGHHFGVITGTEARQGEKPRPPVLLKPGAEKLCALFRLAASFDVKTKDLPNGHREERVICTLTHITSGVVVASAIGSCSTMEAKYRYRNGKPKCPECGAEQVNRSKNEPGFYCWAKKGGCGATFGPNDKRITDQPIGLTENRDIADTFNTVLKMAVKRAHIAATLLATAASDAFVVEEDDDDDEDEKRAAAAKKSEAPKKQEPRQQRADAPADEAKLTPKQELARDCARFASDLGLTADEVAAALKENGIENFKRWSDLDETQLLKLRAMLLKQLNAGQMPAV